METIRIKYPGDLRTEGEHVASGKVVITDAPVDNQGKGEAFSPTDLLCLSLGTCMMTTMGIAARMHDIDFAEVTMKVTKIMNPKPRKVAEVAVDIFMEGKNYSDKQKSILEKAALECPVALSLHEAVKQSVKFRY